MECITRDKIVTAPSAGPYMLGMSILMPYDTGRNQEIHGKTLYFTRI